METGPLQRPLSLFLYRTKLEVIFCWPVSMQFIFRILGTPGNPMLSPRIGRSTCRGTGLTETWTVTVVLDGPKWPASPQGGLGCYTEAKEAAFYIGICPWAFGNLVGHVPCAAWRSIRDRRFHGNTIAYLHTDLLCWKLGCCQLWGLFGGAISSQQSFAATNQHSNGTRN